MKRTRSLAALLLAVLLLFSFSVPAFAEEAGSDAKSADLRYVHQYFGVSFDESIAELEFASAIEKTTGVEIPANRSDAPISYENAVAFAMQAAGLSEFALTYTKIKADSVLTDNEIMTEADDVTRQYLAAALDIELADDDNLAANEALSAEQAATLLCRAAEIAGEGRQYIGRIGDDDILQRVRQAYNTIIMPSNETLETLGNDAVAEQVVTGYNIVDNVNTSRFEHSLTLTYGHSEPTHAVQLLALLISEGYEGYVNLEPKTSAFEYKIEWGPVPDPSPGYYVEEISDDFYVAFALEYNLVFEFADEDMLDRFDMIISDYAKKNSDNPEGKALLAGSWWQPYYFADHDMGSEYASVKDNVVTAGGYALHTTSLNENADGVQEWLSDKAGSEMDVELVDNYVNQAFFRYLNGDDAE